MIVPVGGNKIPIILRQKEEKGSWDIVDGRRQEWVGTLATEMDEPLAGVIRSVKELFERR